MDWTKIKGQALELLKESENEEVVNYLLESIDTEDDKYADLILLKRRLNRMFKREKNTEENIIENNRIDAAVMKLLRDSEELENVVGTSNDNGAGRKAGYLKIIAFLLIL